MGLEVVLRAQEAGGRGGEGYGTDALIWRGLGGWARETLGPGGSAAPGACGAGMGSGPQRSMPMSMPWEGSGLGTREVEQGVFHWERTVSGCAFGDCLSSSPPSQEQALASGLPSPADLFPMATDKAQVPASKVGFPLHPCGLRENRRSGAKPFP